MGGVIWTSRPRVRQPSGPTSLVPGGLLSRAAPGSVAIWTPTAPGGIVTGTAPAFSGSIVGVAGTFNGSSSSVIRQVVGNGSDGVSMFMLVRSGVAPSTAGAYAQPIHRSDTSGFATLSFSWDHPSASFYKSWAINDGSWKPVGYSSLAANTWYLLSATHSPVRGLRIYQNGVFVGADASATGFVAVPTSNFFIGSGSAYGVNPSAWFGGDIAIAGYVGVDWTDAEHAELARNVWQLYAPINEPVFYSLGGGATVTGVGSSDGVGTVSGVSASTSAQVGSSAGVGTASGVGASTSGSVGSSSGTGAVDGVGSSTGGSDGVGASTGTGTASGVGASTATSTGSSDGVGAGSGIGASTAASVGSASGIGEALGVGANGSVVSTGVGSASGTGTATGISPSVSQGGGKTTGSNLSRKQKKKLKAVESQEWLKAEETARQLLSDRFTKQTPQEKAQALEAYIESLQPVIEALKALTSQIEEVVEEAPVIELTPHQEVIQRFDRLEKKVKSVEELIIILMADL